MACIAAPITEAVVVSVAAKIVESKERKSSKNFETVEKIAFSRKLKWLSNLLWGGSALLFFEHVWHGEIVPFFPFLTAASSAEETALMLREIMTVGNSMSLLLTAVWCVMLIVAARFEKKALREAKASK